MTKNPTCAARRRSTEDMTVLDIMIFWLDRANEFVAAVDYFAWHYALVD
jgi:hypothetical protein